MGPRRWHKALGDLPRLCKQLSTSFTKPIGKVGETPSLYVTVGQVRQLQSKSQRAAAAHPQEGALGPSPRLPDKSGTLRYTPPQTGAKYPCEASPPVCPAGQGVPGAQAGCLVSESPVPARVQPQSKCSVSAERPEADWGPQGQQTTKPVIPLRASPAQNAPACSATQSRPTLLQPHRL